VGFLWINDRFVSAVQIAEASSPLQLISYGTAAAIAAAIILSASS
jgi:hypothetical protein